MGIKPGRGEVGLGQGSRRASSSPLEARYGRAVAMQLSLPAGGRYLRRLQAKWGRDSEADLRTPSSP